MVAPWVTLKAEAMAEGNTASVAMPWIQRPIHWSKIRTHLDRVVAIMSDDDQFVPVEDGKVFVRELHAELIMEHHKRHLGGFDGVMALASVHVGLKKMLDVSV
jgi:predicted alpha/beta hydrolase family esterase